jgi:hypothetical protein
MARDPEGSDRAVINWSGHIPRACRRGSATGMDDTGHWVSAPHPTHAGPLMCDPGWSSSRASQHRRPWPTTEAGARRSAENGYRAAWRWARDPMVVRNALGEPHFVEGGSEPRPAGTGARHAHERWRPAAKRHGVRGSAQPRGATWADVTPSSEDLGRGSPRAMDTMQTPIVTELSRLSAHPAAALPWAGLRGLQPRRTVRASRRERTNREPDRPARAEVFTGGRS